VAAESNVPSTESDKFLLLSGYCVCDVCMRVCVCCVGVCVHRYMDTY